MNNELLSFVEAKAKEFRIPGVAVGIYNDGKEHYTCFGVTSIDNPLPITPQTRDKNKVVGIDLAGRLFSKYVNK